MMKTALLFFALLFLSNAVSHAELVDFGGGLEIDFTTIGDAGNVADTTGDPNPAGSVDYEYRISTYEISRAQVEAANTGGSLGISMLDMEDAGYASGNGPDQPATEITWYEAAKFVNYLNTSQGAQAAYKFDGDGNFQLWDSGDAGYDADNLYRNSLAEYWLPDVDEWYKAAYYDPDTGTYFDYPTGSDTEPTEVSGGTTAGTAVWDQAPGDGPAAVDNAGGLSPYGVMGLGGNVVEWQETASDLTNDDASEDRLIRGGFWSGGSSFLQTSSRFSFDPLSLQDPFGFRVAGAAPSTAVIPEPSTMLSLWFLAGIASVIRKRRRLSTP